MRKILFLMAMLVCSLQFAMYGAQNETYIED